VPTSLYSNAGISLSGGSGFGSQIGPVFCYATMFLYMSMHVPHHGRHGGNTKVCTLYSRDFNGLLLGRILHAPGGWIHIIIIMSVSQVGWTALRALTAYHSASEEKSYDAESRVIVNVQN